MTDRIMTRLLKFAVKGRPACLIDRRGSTVLLNGGERGTIAVPGAVLDDAIGRGLVLTDEAAISLSKAGLSWLARAGEDGDPVQARHQDRETRQIDLAGRREIVTVNLRESPLAMLAQRRGSDKKPFLSVAEFEAGERLRADYEFGQIAPRLGVNWDAAVSAGRRSGGNGKADLSDEVLAARRRVNRAIEAVGPELSGVLVDICCFLKGLEQVEMERIWPRRSAKLMLKTALGALARHYAPPRKTAPGVLHWGTADYRPRI